MNKNVNTQSSHAVLVKTTKNGSTTAMIYKHFNDVVRKYQFLSDISLAKYFSTKH